MLQGNAGIGRSHSELLSNRHFLDAVSTLNPIRIASRVPPATSTRFYIGAYDACPRVRGLRAYK